MSKGDSATSSGRPATPAFPDTGQELTILGVPYLHQVLPGQGDLYLTRHGLPSRELLLPENWFEAAWFEANRERLVGTSTIYRVPTREVNGRQAMLVVKWCRVGERVPVDTMTFQQFTNAEFNSPYEEFSLVMELRAAYRKIPMLTHRPLAIFAPEERLAFWRTGRSRSRMARKKAKFRDSELDICRQYILIYEWVKGESIVEVLRRRGLPRSILDLGLTRWTERAMEDLARKGFRVLDMKPEHLIVRTRPDGALLRNRAGKPAYAMVDFELLERTPEHERRVIASRRADYLTRQRDRFGLTPETPFPAHLRPTRVMGVDYVFGSSESTHGRLWVVGHDPRLFDYFHPERWRRTPRRKLSADSEVYTTRTKDDINLVWKVSQVGEPPEQVPAAARARGYNSPFEEFALAIDLSLAGIPTTYPRAIYMSGREAEDSLYTPDDSRYRSHADMLAPDGQPVLRHHHIYINVWGYWNGLDEILARRGEAFCTAIDADQALQTGTIDQASHEDLIRRFAQRLTEAGFEHLDLKGRHLLLSLDPSGRLILDASGRPAVRLCHFALLRRIAGLRRAGPDAS